MARTLYVATMPGCPACAEAKAHLAKFSSPVPVVVFDVTTVNWPEAITHRAPNSTPTYWLVDGKRVLWKREGYLTLAELQRRVR